MREVASSNLVVPTNIKAHGFRMSVSFVDFGFNSLILQLFQWFQALLGQRADTSFVEAEQK